MVIYTYFLTFLDLNIEATMQINLLNSSQYTTRLICVFILG
jgi:hypothetical protein